MTTHQQRNYRAERAAAKPQPLRVGDRVQLANTQSKYGRVIEVHGRRVVVRWDAGGEQDVSVVLVFAAPDEDEIAGAMARLRWQHLARRRAERPR